MKGTRSGKMVKYGVNSYLGMKVTFMNQIYDSAKKQSLGGTKNNQWHL